MKNIIIKLRDINRIIINKFVPSLNDKAFKYGTLSFNKTCKLSFFENFFYKIDLYLEKQLKKLRYMPPETYVFRSFFDQSMGLHIGSSLEKREIEKKHGITYMSLDEKNALTKEAKRNIKYKRMQKHKKAIENIQKDIANGRSFIKELQENKF